MEVENANQVKTYSHSTGDSLNVYKEDMKVSSPFQNGAGTLSHICFGSFIVLIL